MSNRTSAPELRWILLLAFGISWALWTPALLAALGGRPVTLNWFGEIGSNPIVMASLAATFGPMVAAVAVTWRFREGANVRRLFRRAIQLRFDLRWYLAAVLLSPVIHLAAALARLAITGSFDLSHSSITSAVSAFAVGTVMLTPIIIGEELGWRGFALPRLQSEQSAFSSSIILGLAWSVWHLPYWFALAYASTGSAGRSLVAFVSMVPTTIAVTILMTWVFNSARGSVFAAMLMHAALNSTVSIFARPDQLTRFGDLAAPGAALTWATTTAVFITAATGILLTSGSENLSANDRCVVSSQIQ